MQRRLSPLALRRLLSPPPAPVAAERSPPALRRRRRRLWGTFQSPVGDSLVWGFGVPFASSWKPPRLSSPRGLCVVAASGWSGGSELPLARRFCTYDERGISSGFLSPASQVPNLGCFAVHWKQASMKWMWLLVWLELKSCTDDRALAEEAEKKFGISK
ncbi:hypothetical protein ABZP36_005166 [Zizania latifolia]